MAEGLDEKLRRVWQEVREAFFYPTLPDPAFKDKMNAPAAMEPHRYHIWVSKIFLELLEKSGLISPDDALTGLLLHETDHYITCPYDFYGYLCLYSAAKDVAGDKGTAQLGVNLYADAVVNTHITMEKELGEVAALYKTLYSEEFAAMPELSQSLPAGKRLNMLMGELYQQVWKRDIGVVADDEVRAAASELAKLDYLESADREEDMARFMGVMLPFLKDMQEEQKQQKKNKKKKKKGKKGKDGQEGQQGEEGEQSEGQEGQKGQDGQQQPSPGSGQSGEPDPDSGMFDDGLLDKLDEDSFTEDQVREGLDKYSKEKGDPKKVGEMMKDLDLDEKLTGRKDKSQDGYAMFGYDRAAGMVARVQFYRAQAQRYVMPIKKRQMHKDGSLFPHTHRKYQLGDDFNRVDPFNSQGKIIPGLSNTWVYKESETTGRQEGVPDAIICIDASGSMIHPGMDLSPAVLGAMCAANTYLGNGSKVAVMNFSDTTRILEYTRKESEVHEAICYYQNGGTELKTKSLDELVEKAEKKVDILLITDLAILNIYDVVSSLKKHKQTHRITIVNIVPSWAQPNPQYIQFDETARNAELLRQELEGSDNVGFYRVTAPEDIPDIILGETTKSFER